MEIKATQVKPSKEYFLYLNNTDDPKPFGQRVSLTIPTNLWEEILKLCSNVNQLNDSLELYHYPCDKTDGLVSDIDRIIFEI